MVVQWLQLLAFAAKSPGSFTDLGTKIPQAAQHRQKKKKKRCSTSLVIRGIQMKTTERYHITSTRMAIISGENVEKTVQQFLKILSLEFSYDPEIPAIYPREMKTWSS